MNKPALDPSHIMEVGMGFFGSRTLLSAVDLDLFTHLRSGKLTGEAIAQRLRLHPRAIPDFPDALVALGFLDREGDGPEALYGNTAEAAAFLDKKSPQYIGGILEMASSRFYEFWGNLTEALQTGEAQSEIKDSGEPMFAKLYATPERLEQFMNAMAGVSAGNFKALAEKFDFSRYETLCDAGGATGQLSCMVAAALIRICVASLRTCRQLNQLPRDASNRPDCPTGSRRPTSTSLPTHFRRPTSSRWG